MKGPRYMSIAGTLRDRIRGGDYPAGAVLPSQKELAEIFDTTVMTVRQAIAVLETEGLLRIAHGVGTFVASGTRGGRALRLRGFSDSMRPEEARIRTRILEREYDVTDPSALAVLGGGSRHCCRVTRVRTVGNEPVIYQRSYVPPRFRSVIRGLSDGESLYAALGSACGGVVEGREIVVPIALEKREAAALEEKAGAPALFSIRASFDLARTPVLYDEAFIRTTRVFLTVHQSGKSNVSAYSIPRSRPADIAEHLLTPSFWEEDS
ncbi:MAG TPA: GntR family transcriptional regulator [Spirochaetia bacterium]